VGNENKNITLDETAFIIGSGPSLNEIDISLLKNLETFGMNRQYIAFEDWGFEPKYYCLIDSRLINKIFKKDIFAKYITNPKCKIEKFFISQLDPKSSAQYHNKVVNIPEGTNVFHGADICKKIGIDKITELHSTPLERNKPYISQYAYSNCGIFATNLSYMLGYKRAILLGMDCRYGRRDESVEKGKDLEHFHPDYFHPREFHEGLDQGHSEDDGGLWLWSRFVEHINKYKKQNGIDFEILSSSPNSNLHEIIEYVPLEEVLNGKR
tara:strand:- start:1828 stop:2628 length:801 start_codon:yes stop_codon:yes gene_type:complete